MPAFIDIQNNHALSTVARLLQPSSWIEAIAKGNEKYQHFAGEETEAQSSVAYRVTYNL